MKWKLLILLGIGAVLLGLGGYMSAYDYDGSGNCNCTTCADCTSAGADTTNCYNEVKLTADISNQATTCINDSDMASGAVFNCQEHWINGTGAAGSYGFYIEKNDNVVIKNCNITQFERGIYIKDSDGLTIQDNNVTFCTYNIYFDAKADNNILNRNRACNGSSYDIYNLDNNSGDNNSCHTTYNWDDEGTEGCTTNCIGEVGYVVYNTQAIHVFLNAEDLEDNAVDTSRTGEHPIIAGIGNDSTANFTVFVWLNFTSNVDFLNFTTDYDLATVRSFFDWNGTCPPEIINESLLIPRVTNSSRVYVCPDATSLNDVYWLCPNEVIIHTNQTVSGMTMTEVVIANKTYYQVDNVSTTGGGEYSILLEFKDPTPANNSWQTQNWTVINVSIIGQNLDVVQFNWTENNDWVQKATFPGISRESASAASNGTMGFAGLGSPDDGASGLNDWYGYNETSDMWIQKASHPQEVWNHQCDNINETIYCAGGADTSGFINLTSAYNHTSNWTLLADLPEKLADGDVVACGAKLWYICGQVVGELRNTTIMYDPVSNNWTYKAEFPGIAREEAFAGMCIEGNIYFGLGMNITADRLTDWWLYNLTNNTWTQLNDFPAAGRTVVGVFVLGEVGFIVGGNIPYDTSEMWNYTKDTDTWTRDKSYGIRLRDMACFTTPSEKAFCTTGVNGSATDTNATYGFRFNNPLIYSEFVDDMLLGFAFDNSSAGDNDTYFVDISKYWNNGSCSIDACPTYSTGIFEKGVSFDGSNDYIDANNDSSMTPANNFSISAWLKLNDLDSSQTMVRARCSGSNYGYMFGYLTNNRPRFYVWPTTDATWKYVSSSISLSTDRWYYMVATFDSRYLKIYLNGTQDGVTDLGEYGNTIDYNNAFSNMWIGRYTNTYLNGTIDEVRIYNRTLSAEEVSNLYRAGFLRKYNSSLWYYRLNHTELENGSYVYYGWANDSVGNEDSTETRTLNIGEEPCTCTDCTDCTNKLNDALCTTVTLTANITNQSGTCINDPANFTNKVFDCQGYTIDGDDTMNMYGINISGKNHNTIRNCVITDWWYAFYLTSSSNNTITNNTANSNGYYGIFMYLYSDNNSVINNTLNDSGDGIHLTTSSNNTITDNLMTYNVYIGMHLTNSSNNTITDNTLSYNNQIGLYLNNVSNNNSVINNTLCSNNQEDDGWEDIRDANSNSGDNNTCDTVSNWNDTGWQGCTYACAGGYGCGNCENCSWALNQTDQSEVRLQADIINHSGTCITWPTDNKVFDCQGHTIDGVSTNYGINISEKSNNTIQNCVITQFEQGIYFGDCDDVNVTNCTTSNNTRMGINYYSSTAHAHSNGVIRDSTARYNGQVGFEMYNFDDLTVINSTASYTNVTYHSDYGFGFSGCHGHRVEIYNSTFDYNVGMGIDLCGTGDNHTIQGNTIRYTNSTGEYDPVSGFIPAGLHYNTYYWTNTSLNVLDNTICDNSQYDIWFGINETASGINNSCDTTLNWSDNDTTGCTFPCIVAVACGSTITSDVTLTEDLNCSAAGLTFGTSNLILDCAGFTITGSGSYNGIYISIYENNTIICAEPQNFERSIYLYTAENTTINFTQASPIVSFRTRATIPFNITVYTNHTCPLCWSGCRIIAEDLTVAKYVLRCDIAADTATYSFCCWNVPRGIAAAIIVSLSAYVVWRMRRRIRRFLRR